MWGDPIVRFDIEPSSREPAPEFDERRNVPLMILKLAISMKGEVVFHPPAPIAAPRTVHVALNQMLLVTIDETETAREEPSA
jgi:hypothetical protein